MSEPVKPPAAAAAPAASAPAAVPNVVDFKNVTKKFGDLTIIRDVTFSVEDLPATSTVPSLAG